MSRQSLPGRKVPGSKRYRAIESGIRDLGRSPELGDVAENAAWKAANIAKQYDPSGDYAAEQRGVLGGYNNEFRAGAAMIQRRASWKAVNRQVMVDVKIRLERGL